MSHNIRKMEIDEEYIDYESLKERYDEFVMESTAILIKLKARYQINSIYIKAKSNLHS